MGVADGRDLMREEEQEEKKNKIKTLSQTKTNGWRRERDAPKQREAKIDLPDKCGLHSAEGRMEGGEKHFSLENVRRLNDRLTTITPLTI